MAYSTTKQGKKILHRDRPIDPSLTHSGKGAPIHPPHAWMRACPCVSARHSHWLHLLMELWSGGKSMPGLPDRKESGLSMNPVDSHGMTGKSSGLGT